MIYCKKCLQPDTRPGIVFDEEGVCMACRHAEERKKVDWAARKTELEVLANWASAQCRPYDCAIGVSGGKDSHLQALMMREMGLNCLLVNCVPDQISPAGAANIENLIQKGFDVVQIRPNPQVEKALCRRAFFEYGNFVKPLEYTLYASTYRVALEKRIPLVVQGENDANTFGVETGGLKPGGDAMHWADVNTVGGGHAKDWIGNGITMKDLQLYQFPNIEEMKEAGMRAIFLEYYLENWSHFNNTQFARGHGLVGRDNHDPSLHGKINRFSSLDAELKIVNQMIKYLKFGFGACSDEVNYLIREGMMSREQGIRIIERYDGECSEEYIHSLCEYLDITIYHFWDRVGMYVDKKLFHETPVGYLPLFVVGDGIQ